MVQINRNIYSDLYCKDTDTHQYLKFHSCHPSYTKRNIPFNLEKKIYNIVSYSELRTKLLKVLKIYLIEQHYLKNLIGVNKLGKLGIRKTKPKVDQKR